MTRSTVRLAWFAAIALSTAALASCGGDDTLGPPDGTACTAGSIAPGDSVKGAVTSSSCAMFSDYEYEAIWAESWTLHAAKGTAYVVRLRHIADGGMPDNINADLYAYGRNDAGDVAFATGWWSSFAPSNGNGGSNEEIFLVGDKARDYSIRVQIYDLADTGAYTLSVESCPIRTLTAGTPLTGVDLSTGCVANAYYGGGMRHLNFFGFVADSFHSYNAIAARTAGTAKLTGTVSGPDMDVGCYTDNCTWATSTTGLDSMNLAVDIGYGGWHTFIASANADSAATVTALLTSSVLAAPAFATLNRPRPAGARDR